MKRLLELSLTALLAVCCTDVVLEPEGVTPAVPEVDTDMIILGERLEDPYSVDNMTKALEAVYPTKAAGRVPVSTTHYYVRFLPANEQQFRTLEKEGELAGRGVLQGIGHSQGADRLEDAAETHVRPRLGGTAENCPGASARV